VEHSRLLWYVGAITAISGMLSVITAYLRSLERPSHVFWAYTGASVSCLSLGLVLIHRLAVRGALISIICSMAVAAAIMVYFALFASGSQKTSTSRKNPAASGQY
jgi:Na+-driven multidrug efflux pump